MEFSASLRRKSYKKRRIYLKVIPNEKLFPVPCLKVTLIKRLGSGSNARYDSVTVTT